MSPYFNVSLPEQLNATTGTKFNLICQAFGVPRPAITWFKNGYRVTSSSIKGVKGRSMLIFDPVDLTDQGQYWCEANSIIGWNISSTASLTGR